MFNIKIFIFLIILTITSGNTAVNNTQNQDHLIIKSLSLPEVDEASFYKLLKEESEYILNKASPRLMADEVKGLQKVQNKVMRLLKKMNFWQHTKELILTNGTGIALTSIISEIVTVIILPPVLIGLDLFATATFLGVVPSPSYMIPAYITVKKLREKQKLAPKVGQNLRGILKLEKLRRELLGFSIDHRVMSLLIKTLNQDHEINIIRRRFSKLRKDPIGNIIEMSDLEQLVKTHIGKEKINILREFSHGNESVLTYILLQEINNNPVIKRQFESIVQHKIKYNTSPLKEADQGIFLTIHEKREVINKKKTQLRTFRSNMKKELIALGMNQKTSNQYFFSRYKYMNAIDEFTNKQIFLLEQLEYEIKLFEYTYLSSIQDKAPLSLDYLKSKKSFFINRISNISLSISENSYNLKESSIRNMRTYLKALDIFNSPNTCKQLLNTYIK